MHKQTTPRRRRQDEIEQAENRAIAFLAVVALVAIPLVVFCVDTASTVPLREFIVQTVVPGGEG